MDRTITAMALEQLPTGFFIKFAIVEDDNGNHREAILWRGSFDNGEWYDRQTGEWLGSDLCEVKE